MWRVPITISDPVQLRCEERHVDGVAEHAMLLIDERGGLCTRADAVPQASHARTSSYHGVHFVGCGRRVRYLIRSPIQSKRDAEPALDAGQTPERAPPAG